MRLEIEAPDGARLGATLYRPAAANGRAVAILSATGVKQTYYAKFAAYLAERGFLVLTFDYRGIGASRPTSLRGFRARMRDWAVQDAAAALDVLEREAPRAPLLIVGHSFGGQALGLLPQPERIRAALVVSSQSGYWRQWPLLDRTWTWFATHVALPAGSRLFGYFPSSALGFGEDLPAGVAIEWARWCRDPLYLVGALGAHREYARFSAPLLAYAISDDRFAPPRTVDALLALYPGARRELRRVTPRELGVRSIGHFGFFRESFRAGLWAPAADWLARQ